MSHHSYEIKTFDPKAASDADFEALTVLENTLQAESQPDDPSTSVEELKLRLLNIPPIFGFAQWVATDGQEMVAHANIGIPRMDTNKHLVQFDIGVLPEWRRHGLGTRLLSEIADVAEHEERSLLVSGTRTTAPSGDGFMEALGGNVGLATHVNDLNVADLNHALLQEWLKRAPDRAAGFEMLEWEGRYPDDQMDAVVDLLESINLMPTDDLQLEDFHWTAEQIRQLEDATFAQGRERWTFVVREQSTGKLAGYTELLFNPLQPTIADQGGTAVFGQYQNRGLGRWLKAEALEKLVANKPLVERVRTGNAHSNAPMLKINNELGFKPSMTMKLWQVRLDKVREYIARHIEAPVSG